MRNLRWKPYVMAEDSVGRYDGERSGLTLRERLRQRQQGHGTDLSHGSSSFPRPETGHESRTAISAITISVRKYDYIGGRR
jgi:hypothetical protein